MIDFVTNVQIRGRMYSLFGKLENPKKVLETLVEKLNDKNPAIRAETTLFIMRNVKPKAIVLGKPILKELMPKLIANLSHSDKNIREATAKCLAVIKGNIGLRFNIFLLCVKIFSP